MEVVCRYGIVDWMRIVEQFASELLDHSSEMQLVHKRIRAFLC